MISIITVVILVGIVAGRTVNNPPQISKAPDDLFGRRGPHGPNGTAPVLGGIDFNSDKFADDAQWEYYVDKGAHLICLMEATDSGAGYLIEDTRTPPSAASPWKGDLKTELTKWFWHDQDWDHNYWDQNYECDWERMGLRNAFESLGLNARPAFDDDGAPADGHNDCISITHYDENDVVDRNVPWPQMKPVKDQHYQVEGREYTATGGFYQFSMNRIDGAIIAKNINNPAAAVISGGNWGRKAKPVELPDLRFLSDIYWGFWVRNNPNIRNIRVYGAYMVINDATVLLTSRAFNNLNVKELKPWPGTSFSAKTEEGKALIGSPIGATIAHMLLSHKAELGIKHINDVTIVCNEMKKRAGLGEQPQPDMHMFFAIADMPADEITTLNEGEVQHAKRDVPSDSDDAEDSQVLYMKSKSRVREHIVLFDDVNLDDT